MSEAIKKILVTGATGYIGGRLVPRLLEKGYEVRCMARHTQHLEGRGWLKAETVKGDALSGDGLEKALEGTDAAYYLIHSMAEKSADFAADDARAAKNFAVAAKKAAVKRVIYLGGLSRHEENLSRHLRSRHEVGRILRDEGPALTEFRAAVIVGSGSISFEIIRYLVDRLPFLLSFRWQETMCQPVAIRDVLGYLINALETPESAGKIIDIGGTGILTYRRMLEIYAELRGLGRFFIPAPFWSPRLAAEWIGLITPIPSSFAFPLIESLKNEVVCRNDAALRMFPYIKPLDYRTAVQYALHRITEGSVETTWTMALFPRQKQPRVFRVNEGLIADDRISEVNAPAERTFSVFSGIGGDRGWFYADFLWTLRALMDRLMGGVGMRRGRRHPDITVQGEALDFWRVEKIVPDRMLLLRAEMLLPGKGWLQFESTPKSEKTSILRQTAYFEPHGFLGNIYWYGLYPLHRIIFAGLIKEIKNRAEKI
ncbi:MAG: SDR family oxidoreductase [bacterium]